MYIRIYVYIYIYIHIHMYIDWHIDEETPRGGRAAAGRRRPSPGPPRRFFK